MWGEYVSVAEKKLNALKAMEKLRKTGKKVEPIIIDGKKISKKFWGIKWCEHLDTFADYDNRLPRGRTYARNGSICHLEIKEGLCEAIVSGSSLYKISIKIKPLKDTLWEEIKKSCSGKIGSLIELLQGKISDHVMNSVANPHTGLFPNVNEMNFTCSCPDWANMCKHVAAVFYGIGHRLDFEPELLFKLRSVNASELVNTSLNLDFKTEASLENEDLGSLFGIEIDQAIVPSKKAPVVKKTKPISIEKLTGRKLQRLREKKDLSPTDFAKMIGISRTTLIRWEQTLNPLQMNEQSKSLLQTYLNTNC